MSEREVGLVGEALLGRPGVLTMVILWSLGVGCAALPMRFRQPLRYCIPGLMTALILALLPPTLLGVFAFTMVGTGVVMVPALWLIGPDERRNVVRAALLLGGSAILLAVGPLLPDGLSWLAFPFAPVLIFGIPVGLLLVGHRALRSRAWVPAIAASLAFSGAWFIWMARDYYYRLK